MYGSATSDRIAGENEAADRVARASHRFRPVRPWGTSSSSPTPADHGQPCRRGPSREVAGHEGRTASAGPALAVLAPQPPKPPVDDYDGWAHPDFGRHYNLKNYSVDQDNRQHELTDFLTSRSPRSISSTLRSTGRRLGSNSSIASVEMTSGRTGER